MEAESAKVASIALDPNKTLSEIMGSTQTASIIICHPDGCRHYPLASVPIEVKDFFGLTESK